MAGSKYYDTTAAIQVIGCVLNNPRLLDEDSVYSYSEKDFANDFHKVIFGGLYNLYNMGTTKLSTRVLEDYFQSKPESLAIYNAHKGAEWLHKIFKSAEIENFDYYYSRLKKMTLLRTYNDIGLDVSWIYDPDNLFDQKLKEQQDKNLDEKSLNEIAELIETRITRVREMIIDNDEDESCQIGNEAEELLNELEATPAIGYPLYDKYYDKIAMGGRLGKFYLRSAATGTGKSRSAMADACWLSCSEVYENGEWVSTGSQNIPTIFISVELDKSELQTMAWSFVSGVPENHILENDYHFGEKERVIKAIQILKESSLYIEYFPDYSMKDIENCIKRNLRTHKVQCVFLDYITTSMKIIEEITRASGGMKIREDQVLFLLSSKLKDIASSYNVFVFSSTQLNGSFKTERIPDQTLLAGAKSIANRIDFGSIMLDCTPEDIEDIQPILQNYNLPTPNVKCSIYKNRRGKTNRVLLWMAADKGTCRYKTCFVTDYNLTKIPDEDIFSKEELEQWRKESLK